MITVVVEAVDHNDKQGEDEEYVWGHRHIGKILEGPEPAYGDQNEGGDENIQTLDVALVVKGLETDNLVHLLPDEDQVRDTKPNLRCHDVEIDEFSACIS